MKEGRGIRLGGGIGAWTELTFQAIPENERNRYQECYFRELGKISLQPRKKGEQPLSGVHELDGLVIANLDLPNNPELLARIAKEQLHFVYNINTKRNELLGLYDYFEVTPPTNISDKNGS